jgi:hypothetical protein
MWGRKLVPEWGSLFLPALPTDWKSHSREKGQNWGQSRALVAHAYNPSHSGGRDQLSWANSSRDPISKIPNIKKGLVE